MAHLGLDEVAKRFREQSALAAKDALSVIHEAQDLMNAEPNMVHVQGATTYVFGDIHGQFFDLLALLARVDVRRLEDTDVKLIFLGDYVDRGAFSCEAILYLLLLKVHFPRKVFLLRGNHECETISSFYGFRSECRAKYGLATYSHFVSCFQAMPIAALIKTPRGNVFCVHGGLSPDLMDIHDIESIDRHREIPVEGPLCDLLWSDPAMGQFEHEATEPDWSFNNVRGCSYYFNAAALFQFLSRNHLLCVIRAHECEQAGYQHHFQSEMFQSMDVREDKSLPPLTTVFSAPNYCDTQSNSGGYLTIRCDPFEFTMKQVDTVGHPLPVLLSVERSADIWRQFRQTLPFLPASKDFFEEILLLSRQQQQRRYSSAKYPKEGLLTSNLPTTDLGREDTKQQSGMLANQRKKQTSEMHPRAIRRVLDEEASKWMQGEGESGQDRQETTSIAADIEEQRHNGDNDQKPPPPARQRAYTLTPAEVEMMKLCFSLIDTDGSMTLAPFEITQFIFNILGERIPKETAEEYLEALDYDGNGVVDFADILSWAAVLKENYDNPRDLATSLKFFEAKASAILDRVDPYRAALWLMVGYIARYVYLKRYRTPKSTLLRVMGLVVTTLYILDSIRLWKLAGRNRWLVAVSKWRFLGFLRKFAGIE